MIEKGYFFIELSETEILDIGKLQLKDWREIEERSKQIIAAGQAKNKKVAFVAAFLNFVMEQQSMKKPFHIDA